MVENIHELTVRARTWQETTELVGMLNRTPRGWANYFSVGTVTPAYRALDSYAAVRLRRWLRFKHKTRRSKGASYPLPHLYETFGLVRLTRLGRDAPRARREVLSESRMQGNPHVRFDERDVETETCPACCDRATSQLRADLRLRYQASDFNHLFRQNQAECVAFSAATASVPTELVAVLPP